VRLPGRPGTVPAAARKVAGVAEIRDVRADEALLGSLEEAVGENRRLHARLEQVVADIERALVPLLETAQGRR
jgi:hypothetical protein